MNCYHKFGVRIEGQLHSFFGVLDDAEFMSVTAKEGLPPGWVAWHITPSEIYLLSERVQAIRQLPTLTLRWQDALEDARAGRPLGTTGYPLQVIRY